MSCPSTLTRSSWPFFSNSQNRDPRRVAWRMLMQLCCDQILRMLWDDRICKIAPERPRRPSASRARSDRDHVLLDAFAEPNARVEAVVDDVAQAIVMLSSILISG